MFPCIVISVQAAEGRGNMCRQGLLASTLRPCPFQVVMDLSNILWLQIASIEVIRRVHIEMKRIAVEDYTMLVLGCAMSS
jgi:hypothetical protein